ncbi:intracellular septation protein [Pseudochelatococcus lubricantis]|uniref:Inner membrane-spanning protein YciB n=1 Tax=Pseudochelatococcus lubricantis TaxID=1538102 RepID=A0ABX0V0D9_9HYPH|nr:septation protein A [Pseudochelatococcus lubricantis]NIJ57295.1 intracellular septation protein [Pseudochelatococcus lubricantis]
MTQPAETGKEGLPPLTKLLLEMGPLLLFFAANARPGYFTPFVGPLLPAGMGAEHAGIFAATAVFMLATVAALVVNYVLERRVPIMPLVSGIVVVSFGAMTLWLNDDLFIKLKPTIVNCLFGSILLGGLFLFDKPLLPVIFGGVFQLDDEGWRKLTFRWGAFFFVLAAINEIVWRTQSTDFWVSFKVFGMTPITLAFAIAQTRLILQHSPQEEPKEG